MFCRKGGNKYKNFESDGGNKIKQLMPNNNKIKFDRNNEFDPKVSILEFSLKDINDKDYKKNNNLLFNITNARDTYQFKKAKHRLQNLITLPSTLES